MKLKILSSTGSRLTNFVGILSQGLRIAPPEAPATGYMVFLSLPLSFCTQIISHSIFFTVVHFHFKTHKHTH